MKETFIIRTEWFASILKLSESEQATILKNLFRFHMDEPEKIELGTLTLEIIWGMIEPNLKRNIDNYDKRKETSALNGAKGGRPRKEENLSDNLNKPNYPIESLNDSVSVPVSVSGSVVIPDPKDSILNAEIDPKKKLAPKKKAFVPPTVEEVISYFAEKGCNEKFARRSFEHYDVAGWKDVKGNAVASWKQKMLRWIDGATPDQKLPPPQGTAQKMKYNPVVGMIPDND